jgi:hypothetical protein
MKPVNILTGGYYYYYFFFLEYETMKATETDLFLLCNCYWS